MDIGEIERLYYKLQTKELWDKEQIVKDLKHFSNLSEKILKDQGKSPVTRFQFVAYFARIMIFFERIVLKHNLDNLVEKERQKELYRLLDKITPPKKLTWQEKFKEKRKELIKNDKPKL
jgi:hypothetical protein